MEAWGNFWQKGHSTTFGEYYADGYTKGYIADWWSTIVSQRQEKTLNILEVGCGNASLAPCLLDLNIKGTYTGVDAAQIQLSEAVQKRGNHDLVLSLHSETGIENFQTAEQFDLITSVYGLEYSPLKKSLPLLKKLLAPKGQLTLLMHHAKSVITEMSVKALTEFDFEQMEKIVSHINMINDQLNQCQGDLKALSQSTKAETARESVNEFISALMNQSTAERNPILVDFSQSILAFFKKIRLPEQQRRDFIDGILPDFHASKERFFQMVKVARNDKQIKAFKTQLTDAGFINVKIDPINNEGVPVAWNVHAN
jgi:SAM-dependent methyltransferase|tara:strand:- start:9788 stop:10723 length:936 start_codon:yes stop_codon:yes gene_type:complete